MAHLLDLPDDLISAVISALLVFGGGGSADVPEGASAKGLRDYVRLGSVCKKLRHLGTVGSSRTVWWPIATLALRRYASDCNAFNYDEQEPIYWYQLVVSQLMGCFGILPNHLLGISRQPLGYRCDRSQTNRIMSASEAFTETIRPIKRWSYRATLDLIPCPADPSNAWLRHIVDRGYGQVGHFQFVPWLAARLRFGRQPWLFPPPEQHDCPYVGHTEGFVASNETRREWSIHEQTVRVYWGSNTCKWTAVLEADCFCFIFSKYGNDDGGTCLTGEIRDDYHEETLKRAIEFVQDTGKYDMERSKIYTISSFHNDFRADLVDLAGDEYCSEMEDFAIWRSIGDDGPLDGYYDTIPCIEHHFADVNASIPQTNGQ